MHPGVIFRNQFRQRLPLRAVDLLTALIDRLIKGAGCLLPFEGSVKLALDSFADPVHHAVAETNRHHPVVIGEKLLLFVRQFGVGYLLEVLHSHAELAECVALRVLDVCIIFPHEIGIDIPHEIRFLVCHNPAVQIS